VQRPDRQVVLDAGSPTGRDVPRRLLRVVEVAISAATTTTAAGCEAVATVLATPVVRSLRGCRSGTGKQLGLAAAVASSKVSSVRHGQ
jgi:hypothetical protein